MGDEPPSIDGYFWLDIAEATWAWCLDVFGDHCEDDLGCPQGPDFDQCPAGADPPDKPARRRRSEDDLHEFVRDVSLLPEGAVDYYVHRGRRGFIDWLENIGASIPCLTTGDVTLKQWDWTFFEYSQSIPIYGPITLDLSAGAGAFLKIVGSIEACILQLTAEGRVGPQAGVDVFGSASISIVLIRAGIKVRVFLFSTTLTAGAQVSFATSPISLCFNLKYETAPLSAEFSAFGMLWGGGVRG